MTLRSEFTTAIKQWVTNESLIQSAVLFGSAAIPTHTESSSDIDLHIISRSAQRLELADWASAIVGQRYCFRVTRSATGGVRKTTVIFNDGQIDLVVVPYSLMTIARIAYSLRLHHKLLFLANALNEMSMCLANGFEFLKGEGYWGTFYSRIRSEMPGVRLSDHQVCILADSFLCDLLWILEKISRGELAAAQHLLHRSLAETNFRLLRELRLRNGLALPSFGLGRRIETLLDSEQMKAVRVDACLETAALGNAAWKTFEGLQSLMSPLVPSWSIPTEMHDKLVLARKNCFFDENR